MGGYVLWEGMCYGRVCVIGGHVLQFMFRWNTCFTGGHILLDDSSNGRKPI